MPSYNDSLHESLLALYEYLGHLRLSLELVRKLAKHLRFDTYVDNEIPASDSALAPTKRLLIAGTNLLIDIDFAGDHKVTAVALSMGTQSAQATDSPIEDPPSTEIDAAQFVKSSTVIDDVTTICLDFSGASAPSLLGSNGCRIAERVLFQSLSGEYLGTFPQNLRYLSHLDQELFPSGKEASDLDMYAWFLAAVHLQESTLAPETAVAEGWTSRFGKVVFNNAAAGQIGVFLRFYKLSRGFSLPGVEHKVHHAILCLENQTSSVEDYLKTAKNEYWQLYDSNCMPKLYNFDFDLPLPSLSTTNRGLILRLDEPVYLSEQVLEYLDLQYLAALHVSCGEALTELCRSESVLYENESENSELPDITFSFDDASSLIPIQSVLLPSLKHLTKIIPVIRNFILFRELLESVGGSSHYKVKSCSDLHLSDASKKIRDRLKLSKEVPSEELLGLSTFSTDYLNAPILESTTSLQDFVKEESPHGSDTMMKADSTSSDAVDAGGDSKSSLRITVENIWYESPNTDLVLKLSGQISRRSVQKTLRISNGELKQEESASAVKAEPEDRMEVDQEEDVVANFCKALAITGDVILSLQAI